LQSIKPAISKSQWRWVCAPELNPIENVWEYLRGNKLSNTIYENYDDILEKACQAWMFFANDKERIASITTRQWAKVNL
jgi:transposase